MVELKTRIDECSGVHFEDQDSSSLKFINSKID
jgi:hypothetical protein